MNADLLLLLSDALHLGLHGHLGDSQVVILCLGYMFVVTHPPLHHPDHSIEGKVFGDDESAKKSVNRWNISGQEYESQLLA